MASPSLPDKDHNFALKQSSLELPNVTYDLQDVQTLIFICLIGLILIVLFVQIFGRVHYWLRCEAVAQLDIELDQIPNTHPPLNEHATLNDDFDWSHEHATLNDLRVAEIVNAFMEYLAERRQVSGASQEFVELASPCVNYKSLEKTTLEECVICLGGFEDEEMCRVFPVCNHVFHFGCIDNWLRNHLTCPVCRNCIVDSKTL